MVVRDIHCLLLASVLLRLQTCLSLLTFTSITSTTSRGSPKLEVSATPRVVVIGGGWAGFSVADALSKAGGKERIQIDLLDASPRGKGGLAGGWRTTKLQRPVEAGLHGFWREYRNTIETLKRIHGDNVDQVLTPYTPSVLVSESGRVALAPVLGASEETDTETAASLPDFDLSTKPEAFLRSVSDLLPPPLDVALLSEFSPDSQLTVADRISALGLLFAWSDFGQEDKESWNRYDSVSAESLFCAAAGITPTLYRELVTPLLHVLPMCPGYDCSAAAALSCFHVFALQSRGAFDVRWCRGTIAERIFDPWALQLQQRGNVHIRSSARVTALAVAASHGEDTKYTVTINGSETIRCDAVVFAVGGTAMKRLLPSCPPLAKFPVAQQFHKLRGVTCVAVRMFLRPDSTLTTGLQGGMYDSTQLPPAVANAMKDSPVFVCGPRIGKIPQLAETGFCIYDLQRLHDEFAVVNQDGEKEPCAALEVDFFRADIIANMEIDEDVADLALRAIAAALDVDEIDPSILLDISVVRAREAVSHFCTGSASASPSVRLEKGIYFCGDWIDRIGHASWSTEKAVVTGRQAAKALANDFGIVSDTDILPAAPDTIQLSALRQVAKTARTLIPMSTGIGFSPLAIAKQLSGWNSS